MSTFCYVCDCPCEGYLPTNASTKCAHCRHPQGTHPSEEQQPTDQINQTQQSHIGAPSQQLRPNTTNPSHSSIPDVQFLGARRTPAASAALFGVTGVIPNDPTMAEVNAACRNAEGRAQ